MNHIACPEEDYRNETIDDFWGAGDAPMGDGFIERLGSAFYVMGQIQSRFSPLGYHVRLRSWKL